MSQSVTVDSNITIPSTNDDDMVLVKLVEDGAVHIAYGIALFVNDNPVKPYVAAWPDSMVGQAYEVAKGKALRGLKLDCFGRVYLAGDDTVKLHCDFLAGKDVIASSDVATIQLTAANASREFHLRCHFL